MKKLFFPFVFSAAISVMLGSCVDDPVVESHPLSGTWQSIKFSQLINNPDYAGQNVDLYQSDPRFGGDNTLIYFFGTDFQKNELTLNNDFTYEVKVTNLGADSTDTGTWEYENDVNFTLTSDDNRVVFPFEYEMLSLEESEFTVEESFISKTFTDAAWDSLETKYPLEGTNPDTGEPLTPQEVEANIAVWNDVYDQTPEITIFWQWIYQKVE